MKSEKSVRMRRDPLKFVAIWQRAKSVKEAARRLKMTPAAASMTASRLREAGVNLRRFYDNKRLFEIDVKNLNSLIKRVSRKKL